MDMKSKLCVAICVALLVCGALKFKNQSIAAKDGSNGMLLDRAAAAEQARNTFYFFCTAYSQDAKTDYYSDSFSIDGDDVVTVGLNLEKSFGKWLQNKGFSLKHKFGWCYGLADSLEDTKSAKQTFIDHDRKLEIAIVETHWRLDHSN
jgi:hypothetical protein